MAKQKKLLLLVPVPVDLKSACGFEWPVSGPFKQRFSEGGQLIPLRGELPRQCALPRPPGCRYLIIEVPPSDATVRADYVTFTQGRVLLCADTMADVCHKHPENWGHGLAIARGAGAVADGPRGVAICHDKAVARAGCNGVAVSGEDGCSSVQRGGVAVSGYSGEAISSLGGVAVSGEFGASIVGSGLASTAVTLDHGSAQAGTHALARAGAYGRARAGACGIAVVGPRGVAAAGFRGVLVFQRSQGVNCPIVVFVDSVKIQPDTFYTLGPGDKVIPVPAGELGEDE